MKLLYTLILSAFFISCSTEPEDKDCAGVEGGSATIDDCGVCGGNNFCEEAYLNSINGNWAIDNISKQDLFDGNYLTALDLEMPILSNMNIADSQEEEFYIPFEVRYEYQIVDNYLITSYIAKLGNEDTFSTLDSLISTCILINALSWDFSNNECIFNSSKVYTIASINSDTLCLDTNCSDVSNCFQYSVLDSNTLEFEQLSNGYCYIYDEPYGGGLMSAMDISGLLLYLQRCKVNFIEEECIDYLQSAYWEEDSYNLVITLKRNN